MRFLSAIVGCLLFGIAPAPTASADERVRIMAANTTSGNFQSYDPGEGVRIFQGLDPDVVLIQEFNYRNNSAADLRDFVDLAFGAGFHFHIEPGNEQIPNGVISRYPIVASGEWNDSQVGNRDFAWARIDLPGERNLWAVSVHFLTSGAGVRTSQAEALVGFVEANVPAGDYLVIGGDFNTDTFSETALSRLSAVVRTNGRPEDQNGTTGTNRSRARPYDQVLPGPALNALEIPVTIPGHAFTYPDGLVFDSRVFTPLGVVEPVRFGDSDATNMQHQAVVRDFLIPSGTTTEPTSYPGDFAATATSGEVTLTWVDSAADGFLIKAALAGETIAPPADGEPAMDDADLTDGRAQLAVASGTRTVTFSGLPPETAYTFRVFPFNDGPPTDYRTSGSAPTATVSTGASPLAAPVPRGPFFPHASGFTLTWDPVPGADGYRLDVSESPTFSGGAGGRLLSEGFDASSAVPSGWNNGGTANDSIASHYASPSNCRALGSGDTLETPPVDFPAELRFYADSSNAGDGDTATVSYSVGGGTWQPLGSFQVGRSGSVETFDLSSPAGPGGQAGVRFRFESDFNTWYLDDVQVTGGSTGSFAGGYEDFPVGSPGHQVLTGLEPSTTYYYRLRATAAGTAGPDSATGQAATRASGTPFENWAADNALPPVSATTDFDRDGATDFYEFLTGTDPRVPSGSPLRSSLSSGQIEITYRTALVPGVSVSYLAGSDLRTFSPIAPSSQATTTLPGGYLQTTARFDAPGQPRLFLKTRTTTPSGP